MRSDRRSLGRDPGGARLKTDARRDSSRRQGQAGDEQQLARGEDGQHDAADTQADDLGGRAGQPEDRAAQDVLVALEQVGQQAGGGGAEHRRDGGRGGDHAQHRHDRESGHEADRETGCRPHQQTGHDGRPRGQPVGQGEQQCPADDLGQEADAEGQRGQER